jgi:epoxyqueuosine reductase
VLEREVPGARFRLACDAQPLLEKPLAVLAGLGWIGKHGNLLRTTGSSWFFVAVLLTDAERDVLEPFTADHCGTCRACLDACPTGAIVAPQVVDARRCVSYLTIEHVGATDPSLREATGAWVFGCDACQDACPWNAHRTRGGHERLAPGPLGRGPLVRDLLTLDEAGFTLATPKSALKRAGRSGLVRSAATAAGNSGDLSLVPDLAALLRDPVPAVRAHAAWALGRLGGAAAWRALEGARADEDEGVRAEVAGALARAG